MKLNFVLAGVAAACIAGLVAFAYVHLAQIPVLDPQGWVALQERGVIVITIALCAIVVIPVFAILFFFAWKYRADNPRANRHHEPDWDHDNWVAEAIWWAVPACIIACLAVVAWKTSHELDPFKPLDSSTPAITVDVVALDWKWLFIYPAQGIATVNMLEFPAGTPVHFNITADAPMNQFWIPSLGGQIMAMPGMQNQLNLVADATGTFDGRSTEISGAGFAGMQFEAHAVSQDDFNAWVQSVQQGSSALGSTTYAALAAPSEYGPVSTYSTVDPALYTSIIMKYMAPGMSTSMNSATTSMPGMDMGAMH